MAEKKTIKAKPKKEVMTKEVDRELAKIENPKDIDEIQDKNIPAAIAIESKLAQLEAEIERGYRAFDIEGIKGRIYFPSVGDDEESSLAYSQSYNAFIRSENMLSEEQMKEIYVKRKMWTDADDDKIEKLEMDIDGYKEALTELSNKKKKTEKVKKKTVDVFAQLQDAGEELKTLKAKRQQLFTSSIESLSMEVALKSKLTCCVKTEEGKRIWEGLEQLNDERNKKFLIHVIHKALLFWQGLPDDFLGESQEIGVGSLELI